MSAFNGAALLLALALAAALAHLARAVRREYRRLPHVIDEVLGTDGRPYRKDQP